MPGARTCWRRQFAASREDELRFTPGAEHWSIYENVVHVADAELVHAVRIRYVLAEPGATLQSFDQERWARALDYRRHPLRDSLVLFRATVVSTADMLKRAPVEAWEQTGTHTVFGSHTLEELVEDYAGHVPYHLRTIAKRRAQYAQARRSP
jgi:DinB superfamily